MDRTILAVISPAALMLISGENSYMAATTGVYHRPIYETNVVLYCVFKPDSRVPGGCT